MNRKLHQQSVAALAGLALIFAAAGNARAASSQDGGAPGNWLSGYAGARTLGLGGAFVATADDALGMLWNPAGMAFMDRNQLLFENARLFEDTSYNSLGFVVPGSWLPSFGVSMVSLHSGDFERTNDVNDALGTFHEGETAYLFSMARGVGRRFAVGANLKFVQQTVEDFSAGGFGADLGAIAQVTPTLRVGLSGLNLSGPSVKLRDVTETYPASVRLGAALTMFDGRGLVSAELDNGSGLGTQVHGGAEYWVQPVFALRVGYDDTRAAGGMSYRIGSQYQIDYGVADHPLGLMHRIGLSYRFGGFFAASAAEPSVFSPTGETAVTKIRLDARTKAEADSWTLELEDKGGQVVRRFGGPGHPPAHLLWDGKDESGMPLADGFYHYQLVVKDKEGRMLAGTVHKVEIQTAGPQGTVPVQAAQR
jgi:hypothetical protein